MEQVGEIGQREPMKIQDATDFTYLPIPISIPRHYVAFFEEQQMVWSDDEGKCC